jgi:hypothetical protein
MRIILAGLGVLFTAICVWQVWLCRRDRRRYQPPRTSWDWTRRNRKPRQGPDLTAVDLAGLVQPPYGTQASPEAPGQLYPRWSAAERDALIGRIRALPTHYQPVIIPDPRTSPEEDR